MRLACIVGARPNFMKIAPILRAFKKHDSLQPILIHTGQHYDANLSDVFFEELGIARPDISLGIGSGSHGKQTADILVAIENVLVEASERGEGFDRMIVVGDVNSTMAATIAAAKLLIPVAHVEAGLRSFDRTMPEEINRMLTDSICDMLLPSEPDGVTNLKNEGHDESKIHLVGNVMIDTLLNQVERARESDILTEMSLEAGNYGVVTLHRPANVDDPKILESLLDVLIEVAEKMPLIFPVHPRTKSRMESFWSVRKTRLGQKHFLLGAAGLQRLPLLDFSGQSYCHRFGWFARRVDCSRCPMPDDATQHGAPITVTQGTSTLVGSDAEKLKLHLTEVIEGTYKKRDLPGTLGWQGSRANCGDFGRRSCQFCIAHWAGFN